MTSSGFPSPQVSAILITRGNRILTIYNVNWAMFSLPMTKRRVWEDPNIKSGKKEESWEHAALRAVGEFMGETTTATPEFLVDIAKYEQSDHNGVWKRYHFQVFHLPLADEPKGAPAAACQWLTIEDLLNEKREPISPTARFLVRTARSQVPKGAKFLKALPGQLLP